MQVLAARVLLRPADLDAAIDFYERGLGLHRYREFGAPPHRGIVYFLGGGLLELTETAPGAPVPEPPAGFRLWLQVPDLDAALAELDERGIAPTEPAEQKPWGLLEATVVDPDGAPLVLVEVPDDHPLRRDTR